MERKIVLTRHAMKRMHRRKVPKALVISTIRKYLPKTQRGRISVRNISAGIKVVVSVEDETVYVITVYRKRVTTKRRRKRARL